MGLFSDIAEGLFFTADRRAYWTHTHFGLEAETVQIPTKDGVALHGLFFPAAKQAKGTVLHFHCGMQNFSNHLAQICWLPVSGYNVLMFDYRGFGKSPGKATLQGILEDSLETLNYLRKRHDIDSEKIILFAQLLGSDAALRMLDLDSKGVVLAVIESPWATHGGFMRHRYGPGIGHWLGALLPKKLSEPADCLARIKIPIVLVLPGQDRSVPSEETDEILRVAPNQREVMFVPDKTNLNIFAYPCEWRERLLNVMDQAVGILPSKPSGLG